MRTVRAPTAEEAMSFTAAIKTRNDQQLRTLVRDQLPHVKWELLTKRLSVEDQTWLLQWALEELTSPEDTGGYCGA